MNPPIRITAMALVLASACTCGGRTIQSNAASPEGDLDDFPKVVRFQLDAPLYDPAAPVPQLPPPKVMVTPPVPFRATVSSPTSVDVSFAGALAPATEYVVKLAAGLESADHQARLKRDAVATFRTPRNAVERVTTSRADGLADEELFIGGRDGQTGAIAGVGPNQPLHMRLRFPVSQEHLKALTQVFVEDGQPIPITLSPENKEGSTWTVAPEQAWPRDARLRLTIAPGLPVDVAGAGPLKAASALTSPLHTWSTLTANVEPMNGAECVSPKVLPIVFSNPVECQQVADALHINDYEGSFRCVSSATARRVRVELNPPLPGAKDVELQIKAGLKDAWGETLKADASKYFQTCIEGASFAYQKPFLILDPGQASTHVERLTGADSLKVEGKRLGLTELWALLRTQDLADQVAWTSLPWWLGGGGYDFEWEGEDEESIPHERNHRLPGEMARAAVEELKNAQSVTIPVKSDPAVTHGKTEWRDVSVDLEQFLGGKHGLLLLRTTPLLATGQTAAAPQLRVLNVTDIGLSARLSNDTLVVMAARYSDASPIEGVQVALQTEEGAAVAKGTTGADGLLSIPAANVTGVANLGQTPLLISARKDDDEAFLWTRFMSDREGHWRGRENHLLGSLYPDRGIYRPGEKMHVHGVVRIGAAGGFTNPAGQTVHLQIRTPEWDEFLTKDVTLNEFGSFNEEVEIPASARLGNYSMDVSLDGSSVSGWFRVGEYRRAEMKVEVHAPTSAALGDKLRATVQGDYLFGAPAAGRPVRWVINRSTQAYHSERFPEAVFWSSDRDEWWQRTRMYTLSSGTGELDDKGAFSIIQPLKLPSPTSQHERLTISATIEDASGQTVSTDHELDLFGSRVLVGIQRSRYLVPMKEKSSVTIVAVNRDDSPAANTPVKVYTHLHGWRSVRRQGPSGGVFWQSESIDTGRKQQCSGRTDDKGQLVCEFTPEMGGDIEITAIAEDGTKNARAATWVWVYGDANYWTEATDTPRAQVFFDKPQVMAGETAKVALTSPFKEGYALVTVEREDVLWKKAFPMGTSATIDIPTELAWAPNVQVMATIVRARVQSGSPDPEHDRPAYALGRAELKVRPTTAALDVKLEAARPVLEPGQQQSVTARVTRTDGSAAAGAEVNLWAVDEGVLMLTGYKTPDVLTAMFQPRGWSTIGLDTRQYILGKRLFIEPVVKGEEDGGGGGDENEDRLRKNFDPLAVWVGSAITNEKGEVTSSFTVPDTLTTYRVMATVVTKDNRFGQGEVQFKVNKTLMLRQSLPRFSRPGDTFTAGVLVNHLVATPVDVTVKLDAVDEQLFQVTGPREKQVTVKPNETQRVLFDFRTNDAAGASELQFSASMKDHRDRVELKLPVVRLVPRESVATSGVVSSGTLTASLTVPPEATPISFEVNASGMPLSALEGRLREMVDYPYGCLEQKTSKVVPLVAIRELADRVGMKSIPSDQIKQWVTEFVSIVPRYRCSDGGFDYWPGCNFGSSTQLTAFALDGLLMIKRYGFEVPQSEIDQTRDYLKRQVESGSEGKDQYGGHGHGAGGMMSPLRVLAEAGTPLPQVEKASFDRRASFPLFAKAELTRAMGARLGRDAGKDANVQTLLTEITQGGRTVGGQLVFPAENAEDNWWAWESTQRNTALVLRTLLQVTPADGRVPLLMKGLIDLNKESRYYITSDTTETLLGLVEAIDRLKLDNSGAETTIKAAGQTLASSVALGAKDQSFPLDLQYVKGAIPLEISSTGKAPVFFGAFLNYSYAPSVRLPATANGFRISRSYETDRGQALTPGKDGYRLQAGDIVKVKLSVDIDQEGRLVVVEDPLPAGLEVLDTALATTERVAERDGEGYARGGENDWQNTWHRELRDDRVEWHFEHTWKRRLELSYLVRAITPGVFHVPGAHAERMYQPAVNGRSESTQFTVVAKE